MPHRRTISRGLWTENCGLAAATGKTYRFSANFTYSTYPFMAAYVVNALPGNAFYPLDGSYTVSSLAFEPWGEDTALYFTAPADTVVLQLAFLVSTGYPVTVYIDDVLLEEVTYTHRVICLTAGELADRDGGEYRWSFNGYERDDEVKGFGKYYGFSDYGYDPLIGRRWNVDPLAAKFPYESQYIYAGNSPVVMADIDGEKKTLYIYVTDYSGNTTLTTLVNEREVRLKSYNSIYGKRFYTADVEQSIFYDLRDNSLRVSAEKFSHSDQSYFKQLAKNWLDARDEEGKQPFGYNVYSSRGFNSPLFEQLKGKARVVESLDISGMFPDLNTKGLLDVLKKIRKFKAGLNDDVVIATDILTKSVEGGVKVGEAAIEIEKHIMPTKKFSQCEKCGEIRDNDNGKIFSENDTIIDKKDSKLLNVKEYHEIPD